MRMYLLSIAMLWMHHLDAADHDLPSPCELTKAEVDFEQDAKDALLEHLAAWKAMDCYDFTYRDTLLAYRNYQNRKYQEYQFELEKISHTQWWENEQKIKGGSPGYEVRDQMTLPVVFHILHSTDTTKVREEVDFQLAALNRDFGIPQIPEKDMHDPDGHFASLATDTGIRFVLSKNSANGIARIEANPEKWSNYDAMKKPGEGSGPMDPGEVINIWVISANDRVGSYAQYPGGPIETDGIVIDERYFGRGSKTYSEGKTLTHLMGNYLGLHDLWGLYPCTDDGVSDTPIHNAPNLGDPVYKRVSTCRGYPAAMLMNFMDNTDDKNMYMFTKGQVQRMRYILSDEGLRSGLTKSE